jgi:hypothetical protein
MVGVVGILIGIYQRGEEFGRCFCQSCKKTTQTLEEKL